MFYNFGKENAVLTKIGLDLGYANITLTDTTLELYREPSVALVYKDARPDAARIISVGNSAINSESNDDGLLVRPFKNGILFDHQITSEIISKAISVVQPAEKIRCVVATPSDFLPKQEKELFDMLKDAGVNVSLSVSRPIAALIGAGYSPNMSVISVNVGALSTDIAVLHKGKVILSSRENVGGENFDLAVKKYILEQGDLNISLIVARSIKEKLGAVWKGKPNESLDIEGTLSMTGSRLKMNITTEDIVGVFEEPLHEFMMKVVEAVNRIPAEAVKDIFENGIVLTGGGAELYGLDTLMEKVLGISVTKPEHSIDSVGRGLARINNIIPEKAKLNNKNVSELVGKYYEETKN